MQANEYSRERDLANEQLSALRAQLQQSQQEAASVQRSVAEEKREYKNRLEEDRKAEDRARAQLESRMEEIQKRKSKFVCL